MITGLASLTLEYSGTSISHERIKDRYINGIIKRKNQSLPDYAIGSLAKLLGNIVTFINDKVLVEDLEDLAALEISHVVGAATSYCSEGRSEQDVLALRYTIGQKLSNQFYGVRLV